MKTLREEIKSMLQEHIEGIHDISSYTRTDLENMINDIYTEVRKEPITTITIKVPTEKFNEFVERFRDDHDYWLGGDEEVIRELFLVDTMIRSLDIRDQIIGVNIEREEV